MHAHTHTPKYSLFQNSTFITDTAITTTTTIATDVPLLSTMHV
jgi:hypothetical protein